MNTSPTRTAAAGAALALAVLAPSPASAQADDTLPVDLTGRYTTGQFDESAAEIVAYDADGLRAFVVNAHSGKVDVLDVTDPTAPAKVDEWDAASLAGLPGGVVNSIAVHDGQVAVAVAAEPRTEPGAIVFADTEGEFLAAVPAGANPDSVAYSPDGSYLVSADEGEPDDDYSTDPAGTVTVVDASTLEPSTADFTAWDEDGEKTLPEDVRIFGPEWTLSEPDAVSRNLEPEYVAVDPGGAKAYVTLQENNAVAVVDLASAEVTDVHSLGFKDHGAEGNGFDPSDKDGKIDIAERDVYGMYQPDGFRATEIDGETYLVTANEGDGREWGEYSEEARVEDLDLCEGAVEDADALGRLKVTTTLGYDDEAGCHEDLYAFGSRSFSIWTTDGDLVFDSGSDFERILAEELPEHFNADNDENDFDARSDAKGPEAEDVAVGEVDGRTYAFVGLERQGGILVYDISDPVSPEYVRYVSDRDFSIEPGTGDAGDLGPESLKFVAGEDSPSGDSMLIVGNEVSGSTTLYTVGGENGSGTGSDEDDSAQEKLPVTGASTIGIAATGAVLLVAGGALVWALRRKELAS
ncbi:choice-of-anchor I family protein [Salininema proteolyticum]|uniref:Choice-of-anchor I family protein n=1 Tax=Salininema proteolyticum TaxID=1607685 RepID=A0ABV8TZH2_9ACTN